MKIGILTYHRAENYGALLQSYALLTYLKSLGHNVSFVDYWPKYHSDYFKLMPWREFGRYNIRGKIKFFLLLLLWFFPRYIRKRKFMRFMRDKLALSSIPIYNENTLKTERFDMVIYGSDQIWRKQKLSGIDFDDWYFGSDKIDSENKIVYAGSMGVIDCNAQDNIYVKSMMCNFSLISVRELDLKYYLDRLGVISTLVVDPVFLLSEEQWRNVFGRKTRHNNRYILFYNLLNTAESNSFAERLSRALKLPIIEINKRMTLHHLKRRFVSTASVPLFLQLIDNADYVVSNSFHGVAFSILLKKQFYAVGMGEKSSRVKTLLMNLEIKDRYVNCEDNDFTIKDIDYQKVVKCLDGLIQQSKQFLAKSFCC